jgi:prophage antirepressor-like protein
MKKENAQQGAQSVLVSGNEYSTASHMDVFNNAQFGDLTVLTGNDNNPWFVGGEVAKALGYKNPRDALAKHVDGEDKGVANHDTLGGEQEVTTINESGLYALIFSSKLDQAKAFKRWVTKDVLPSIRKHGGYTQGQEELSSEQLIAKALLVATSTIDEKETENARLASAIEDLTQQFLPGKTIPEFCMQLNGVNTQKVQGALVDQGVLVVVESNQGHGYKATPPYRNRCFVINQYPYAPGKTRYTPIVTPKGADFLYKRYQEGKLPMLNTWDGNHTTSQLPKNS